MYSSMSSWLARALERVKLATGSVPMRIATYTRNVTISTVGTAQMSRRITNRIIYPSFPRTPRVFPGHSGPQPENDHGAGRTAGPMALNLRRLHPSGSQHLDDGLFRHQVRDLEGLLSGGVPDRGQHREAGGPDVPRRVGAFRHRVQAAGPLLGTDDDLA